jgi:mannose/cellobiose epimerase-like protein (N-acyl-D-glucosamine 2-epimerase family)
MGNGIHSMINPLTARLTGRWCAKWYGAFSDSKLGGFYERLNRNFKPLLTGQRRLVTQCRQLAIYSHDMAQNSGNDYKNLKTQFEFIVAKYHDPKSGLWWFSIDDEGKVKDQYCDLYALSFVIFSFSFYFQATGDERAKTLAKQALAIIDQKFRMTGLPGFAEALDDQGNPLPKLRRQNPHMHLLEACLFAYDTWSDDAYLTMADELVVLFHMFFYRGSVHEFFTDDLRPHPEEGHKLEPGHFFEWIWLLKHHAKAKNDPFRHDGVCAKLLDWANHYGWDDTYGGIYDSVSPGGDVLAGTKRIWPFCEALKANTLMINAAHDRQQIKDRISDMVDVFMSKYMDERGFWTEWLERDLTPATDYMPGTTPYHVYFGIMETRDIVDARGGSKSLTSSVRSKLYHLRRAASQAVRNVKTVLAK